MLAGFTIKYNQFTEHCFSKGNANVLNKELFQLYIRNMTDIGLYEKILITDQEHNLLNLKKEMNICVK